MSTTVDAPNPLSGDLSIGARALLDDPRAAAAKAALDQADLFSRAATRLPIQHCVRALAAWTMRDMPWIGITEERLRQSVDSLVEAQDDPGRRRG